MGISVIGAGSSSGGGGGGVSGNFVINTGDYSSNTAQLSREYEAGAYGVLVSPTDSTLDIYLIASDGSLAGYSNIGSITATVAFDKVVILGSTSNTSLSFSFNGESQQSSAATPAITQHPRITSIATSSLPNVDDTTAVNGENFAADVAISFIDQSSVETAAKNVVRSSSTQLIITRPDTFSPDSSPYTIKAVNPSLGSPPPVGSGLNLLSNSVTAGTNPVWTTGSTIVYKVGAATSVTLLATDTEASDIDYSIVSGTLPAGLTLDGETGVISGTVSGTPADGDVTAVTIRAIDTGANFLDRAFNFTANSAPAWTSSASFNYYSGFQLVADGGVYGGALSFTLQSGTLLSGTSLNSSGFISGVTAASLNSTATFTIRATDEDGLFAERQFTATSVAVITGGTDVTNSGYKYHYFRSSDTLTVNGDKSIEYLIVAGGGGGGSPYAGGGGGAGGMLVGTYTIPIGSHSITVGTGGAGGSGSEFGYKGLDSSIGVRTAFGGGGGGNYGTNTSRANGGSGGGSGYNGPAGLATQTSNNGGTGYGNNGGTPSSGASGTGSGGGGAYAAGTGGSGGAGGVGGAGGGGLQYTAWASATATGSSNHYAGGGGGSGKNGNDGSRYNNGAGGIGGGGTGSNNGNGVGGDPNSGGGGGGSADSGIGGSGGSGVVIIRYAI
jgi:hypothetical protein